MNVFRISTILVCCFFLLLFCSAIFIVFVPMDFYSTANGRIVPARSMKVSFPENGIVDFIRQETSFEKGDILARQNTEYEGKMLAVLKNERETLESELAAQTQRSEIDRRKWEVELKNLRLRLRNSHRLSQCSRNNSNRSTPCRTAFTPRKNSTRNSRSRRLKS